MERLQNQPEYCPIEGQEEAKKGLNRAITAEEKLAALSKLLDIYFCQRNYLEVYFLLDAFIDDPLMVNHRAYLLFQKGRVSECLYEFDSALDYYCRALASPMISSDIQCSLWKNVGFCWLYKQDFKNAEICCRRAIELDRNQWEAWKNLGMILEGQGRLDEACDAYRRAVQKSFIK